jgi:hypothetical protein
MTIRSTFGNTAGSAPVVSPSRPSTDNTLQWLVDALAEEVAAKAKTGITEHLKHAVSGVQPVLLNVKEAAVYLGRSGQAVQHLIG